MQEFIRSEDTALGQLGTMWEQSQLNSEARIQQMQVDYATEMEARRAAALAEIERQTAGAQAAIDAATARAAIVQKTNSYVPNLYGDPAVGQPSTSTPSVSEPKVGTEAFLNTQPVLIEQLAKQTRYPWVRTAKDFLDLPTAQRQELIADSITDDAKRFNWTADEAKKTADARHKYLTYGDFKDNRAPNRNWVVNNDFGDKFAAAVDSGFSKVGQAIASTGIGQTIGASQIGQALGFQVNELASVQKRQKDQAGYEAQFSEYTRDQDKVASFRAAQEKYTKDPAGFWQSVANVTRDGLANPGAALGNITPAIAAALVAAVLTKGKSLGKQVLAQAGVGAAQGGVGSTSAQFDELMALPDIAFAKDKTYLGQVALGKSPLEAKAYTAGTIAYSLANVGTASAIGAGFGAAGAVVGGAALASGARTLAAGAQGKAISFATNALADAGLNVGQAAGDKLASNYSIDTAGLDTEKLGMSGVAAAAGSALPSGLAMTLGGTAVGRLTRHAPIAGTASPLATPEPPVRVATAVDPQLTNALLMKDILDGRALPAAVKSKLDAAEVAMAKAKAREAVGVAEAPITPVDVNGKTIDGQPVLNLPMEIDPKIRAEYAAYVAKNGPLPTGFTSATLTDAPLEVARTMAAAADTVNNMSSISVPAPPPVSQKTKKNTQREYFNSVADVELFTDPARPLSSEARVKLQDTFDALPAKTKRVDRATVEQAGVNLLDITAPSTTARGMTHAEVLSAVTSQQDAVMEHMNAMTASGLPVLAPVSGNGWQVNTPAGPITYPTKAALLRGVATNPALATLMPDSIRGQSADNTIAESKGHGIAEANLPDTLFAFDKSRGQQAVGEAVKQADGTWKAKYTDASLVESETVANSYSEAQAWLHSQSPGVRVTIRQVGSGQKGMTESAMRTEAMALPHLDKVTNMFRVVGVPDATAHAAATKILAPFQRFDLSTVGRLFQLQAFAQNKYAAMRAVSDRLTLRQKHEATNGNPDGAVIAASLIGDDRLRQNLAKAVAERRSGGMFEKTLGDHVVGMAETKAALKKLGIGEHTSQNIGYALDALSRNDEVIKSFPTDLRGDLTNPDAAQFAYFKDTSGGIVDLQAGLVKDSTPPGLIKVSGVDAPMKFLTELASVSPDVATGIKSLGKNIADINQRVRDLMLTHGTLTTKEYEALGQRPFYVPLREIETVTNTKRVRATGRHTSAVYPLDQLIAHAFKHSEASFHKLNIKEFGEMLKLYPMTDIATINSAEKKLRPAQGDTESGHIWGSDNRFGKDAASYVVGNDEFVISFKSPEFAKMFRPGESGPFMRDVLLPTAQLIQRAWTLPRTGLEIGHMVKTAIAWDPILMVANVQGAAGRTSDGSWFISSKDAITMPVKILRNMYKHMGYASKQSITESFGNVNAIASGSMELDLMRAYYARNGGGITMHAQSGFDVSPGLSVSHGKVELRGASMLKKAKESLSTVSDVGMSIGHITPTAMRLAAFEAFVRLHNGGILPQSVAAWGAWEKTKPEVAAASIKYSKEILGNFEKMGASAGVRAIFPFFNAGMIGTFTTIPQILTSPHGQKIILSIIGLAAANAMMGMGEKDDDGKDKYFRTGAVWNAGPTAAGAAIPMPHETKLFHNMGTFAAAYIAHMGGDNSIDINAVNTHMLRSLIDLAPIKTAPFEGSSWMTAAGIFAWPILQLQGVNATNQVFGSGDAHGNWVADIEGRTTKATNAGVVPDFAKFGVRNSPLQVATAQLANQITGGQIDVTPDSVKSAQQYVMGTWYGYSNEYQKAYLESGGDEGAAASAAAAYVFRAFSAKNNEYGVSGTMRDTTMRAVRDSLLDMGKARVDGGIKNQDVIDIETARKSIEKLRVDGMTLPEIRRQMSFFQQSGNPEQFKESKSRETMFIQQASRINGMTLKLLEGTTDD